jgi:A/G-specific adenine glycosylase
MRPATVDPASLASRLLAWFDASRRDLPWRRTRDPYRIWVSEVMLQQTQVATVIPYYRRFLRAFPTLRKLAAAPLDEVLRLWAGLGYYSRARNLHAAAKGIVERHRGRFPPSHAQALALPGIGAYTAGAILSIAYGVPLPAIDRNATRVLARVFLVRGDVRSGRASKRIEALATAAVPADRPGAHNQALMELGSLVCTPKAPRCAACCLARLCEARRAGWQERIPQARERRPARQVRMAAAVVWRRGRVLIVQRAPEGVWGGLWQFPAVEVERHGPAEDRLRAMLRDGFGLSVEVGERVALVRHGIMNQRIELAACQCTATGGRLKRGKWVAVADLEGYAMPAPHRRISRTLT